MEFTLEMPSTALCHNICHRECNNERSPPVLSSLAFRSATSYATWLRECSSAGDMRVGSDDCVPPPSREWSSPYSDRGAGAGVKNPGDGAARAGVCVMSCWFRSSSATCSASCSSSSPLIASATCDSRSVRTVGEYKSSAKLQSVALLLACLTYSSSQSRCTLASWLSSDMTRSSSCLAFEGGVGFEHSMVADSLALPLNASLALPLLRRFAGFEHLTVVSFEQACTADCFIPKIRALLLVGVGLGTRSTGGERTRSQMPSLIARALSSARTFRSKPRGY